MRSLGKYLALAFIFGGTSALVICSTAASAAPRSHHGNCVTKLGRGWAPTLDMAKFQAWEIVAQKSGNWPIATDKLTNERYRCQPEGSMYRCDSRIDVCKS